jgi:hypothetical protein
MLNVKIYLGRNTKPLAGHALFMISGNTLQQCIAFQPSQVDRLQSFSISPFGLDVTYCFMPLLLFGELAWRMYASVYAC